MYRTEKHLEGIRSRPQYANAHMFVYIETNADVIGGGRTADIFMNVQYAPITIHHESRGGKARLGVMTGDNENKMYADNLKMVLSNGILHFPNEEEFVSSEKVKIKETLITQMRMYRLEERLTKCDNEAFSVVKQKYSGKYGGRKDDTVMVLQIAIYHGHKKRESAEYESLAVLNGWRL